MSINVDGQEEDRIKFQEGNQWLSAHNGLKGSQLENATIPTGYYSDSLSRKLDRILNDHEYSDIEDAENLSVQGNLEVQVSKLLDDTEDEISCNAWSAGSSSSSVEHLSPRDFIGMGMFAGASNSNLELSSKPVQPLGVELAAALDSSSQHSNDSEETVGEEDGSVLCVYNNAIDLKNGWLGSDNESDIGKVKEKGHKKPSSAMYPSSSSSDSDSDEICIKNFHPPKQYSVVMSSENGSTPQCNEAENSHSTDMPNSPVEHQLPALSTTQETIKNAPPVEDDCVHESAITLLTLLETKAPDEQSQVELPLVNNNHSSESPIATSPLDQETTTNTPPPAKPSTTSHDESLSDKSDVKSGTPEENELEVIKLQLQEVLTRQTKMMESFRLERKQLRLDNYKQRKIITKLQRERKTDHCKLQNVVRHANMRVESVEAKMVALVEQCAILKEHITELDTEFQNSPVRISPLQSPSESVLSPPATEGINNKGKKLTKAFSTGMVTKHKVKKLQKFFGESPPLLQMFLAKLGYEQYLSYFERERIGLVELPHITEEQLIQLGIPMGPRQRIIDEAAKL